MSFGEAIPGCTEMSDFVDLTYSDDESEAQPQKQPPAAAAAAAVAAAAPAEPEVVDVLNLDECDEIKEEDLMAVDAEPRRSGLKRKADVLDEVEQVEDGQQQHAAAGAGAVQPRQVLRRASLAKSAAPAAPVQQQQQPPQPAPAAPAAAPEQPASAPEPPLAKRPKITPGNRSQVRLLKEFERAGGSSHQFKVELINDDIFKWKVLLYFDKNTQFGKDLEKWGKQAKQEPALVMEFQFGNDHPFSPPTARLLRPRVQRGTGYVLGEGAICVDLLAPTGWSPANRIETVLEALRSLFLTQGYEARVDFSALRQGDYTFAAWRDSWNYLKKAHPSWHR